MNSRSRIGKRSRSLFHCFGRALVSWGGAAICGPGDDVLCRWEQPDARDTNPDGRSALQDDLPRHAGAAGGRYAADQGGGLSRDRRSDPERHGGGPHHHPGLSRTRG